ncbi:hypothetical protein ACHAXH_009115 [Discostella pseudostelligera]
MITTTTLFRQGLRLASKRRINFINGTSKVDLSAAAAAAQFSTNLLRGAAAAASNSVPEPNLRHFSHAAATTVGHNSFGLVTDASFYRSQLGTRHSYYQTSTKSQQQQSAGGATAPVIQEEESKKSKALHHQAPLPDSIRSIILQDLRSVDADNNGKIGADELMALLRKHNDTFTESEILELGEIFYTSLGASSVEIDRFMDAIDAAVASKRGVVSSAANTKDDFVQPMAAKGKFKTHPLGIGTCASEFMFAKTHGKYTEEELNIQLKHLEPTTFSDKTALFAVKCVRLVFDTATMWNVGSITKNKILNRAIFLETIAAIPGMVAAIIRHFRSLRNMSRDGGMLNMFLEEANNERMHLLTFIKMKQPGYAFRAAVIGAQFGFGSSFLAAYMINPAWCHRFVGYIEEEACHTYTKILREMDNAETGS